MDKKSNRYTNPKGKVCNPNGRPKKGQCLTDVLRSKLNAETLADTLLELAYAKDFNAIKYIYDRCDGKPIETIDHGNKDDSPFKLEIEVIRADSD